MPPSTPFQHDVRQQGKRTASLVLISRNWLAAQDECTGWWCPPGGLPSGEAANLGQVLRRSSNDHLNIQMFSEGNGNEHRGSFHGYPKGFSQVSCLSATYWDNNR